MEDEYVNLNYPKSISTEYYNIDYIKNIIDLFPDVNKFDLLRTFVRFTALSVYENINFSRSIISLMLWLLIMVAAFNLIVSLIMIVKGKASDIAILRALGASPLMIRSIFIWQGGLIGLIGIIFGVILGIVGSFQIGNLAAYVEDLFSINLLNADVYPIDFLPSEFSIFDVGSVVAGVFLLSILATIYPSSKAASTPPAESLRSP